MTMTKPINRTVKITAEKVPDCLHHRRRPTKNHKNHKLYKLYRVNHGSTKNFGEQLKIQLDTNLTKETSILKATRHLLIKHFNP